MAWNWGTGTDWAQLALAGYGAYNQNRDNKNNSKPPKMEFINPPMTPEQKEVFNRALGMVDQAPNTNNYVPYVNSLLAGYGQTSFTPPKTISGYGLPESYAGQQGWSGSKPLDLNISTMFGNQPAPRVPIGQASGPLGNPQQPTQRPQGYSNGGGGGRIGGPRNRDFTIESGGGGGSWGGVGGGLSVTDQINQLSRGIDPSTGRSYSNYGNPIPQDERGGQFVPNGSQGGGTWYDSNGRFVGDINDPKVVAQIVNNPDPRAVSQIVTNPDGTPNEAAALSLLQRIAQSQGIEVAERFVSGFGGPLGAVLVGFWNIVQRNIVAGIPSQPSGGVGPITGSISGLPNNDPTRGRGGVNP